MAQDPIVELISNTILEEKAEDLTVLDVAKITILADYFIIASGKSTLHVRSMAEQVEKVLKEKGLEPLRKEGQQEGKWVILDYNSVILHLFRQEEREYYKLEDLWGDARKLTGVRSGI